jgi:hypothetical protein
MLPADFFAVIPGRVIGRAKCGPMTRTRNPEVGARGWIPGSLAKGSRPGMTMF